MSGYTEAVQKLSAADEGDAIISAVSPFVAEAVADSNAAAQGPGVDMALAFVDNAGKRAVRAISANLAKSIATKGAAAMKTTTKVKPVHLDVGRASVHFEKNTSKQRRRGEEETRPL